jgi:DNA-binding XRE family transcriptional regulator
MAATVKVNSAKIKSLRRSKMITQSGLAELIGRTRRTILTIEGTGITSEETAFKLAEVLGVSFDTIKAKGEA